MHQELVVLTLGVIRIGKPYCVLTARVLFDGTDGSTVNTKTRIGDQELAPVRCRFGSRDQIGLTRSASRPTDTETRGCGALSADLRVTAMKDSEKWHSCFTRTTALQALPGLRGQASGMGKEGRLVCSSTVGRIRCSGSDARTAGVSKAGTEERQRSSGSNRGTALWRKPHNEAENGSHALQATRPAE